MSRFTSYHFLPLAAAFLAASGLARGFAAAFAGFLAGAFFFAAFGASSSPSTGAGAIGFSRFGRGPTVGWLSLVRISVMRSTVISSRKPRLGREFLRRRFLNEITLGPRLCCSTSAATEAPATVGAPSTGESPPTSRTSPSCTIVPTSPAILPISSTSSGTTRYCRPPVLMTANIVEFLRVRSRPRRYSLKEHVRAGFFFSRYGFNFRASGPIPLTRKRPSKPAQKQTARENPRRIGRTYSGRERRVKVNEPENQPNMRDLAQKPR